MADRRYGQYSGPIRAELLVEPGEDFRLCLLEELAFTDTQLPGAPVVRVPAEYICDGASIPAWAWSFIGAPLSGDFRRAAVIHDWECYLRAIPSAEVHARFYRAMRADDVGWFRAKAMYLAVRYFGPQF